MPGPHEICVVDTSSLLAIREIFGRAREGQVFSELSKLASKGYIVFPPEVRGELERGSESPSNPDPALQWARRHQGEAERRVDLDRAKDVLRRVPDVIDPENPREQADPYVLALA